MSFGNIGESRGDMAKIIGIILIFLLGVFGLWVFLFSGKNDENGDPQFEPAPPIGEGGDTPPASKPPPTEFSFYKDWIVLELEHAPRETYPEKEYITIVAIQSNLSPLDITDWELMNAKGERIKLGEFVPIPRTGEVNQTAPLTIQANDRIIVSSGRSPIGASFRVNKCSEYLEQFQDFVPKISTYCPQPSWDSSYYQLDYDCQNFIAGIPFCQMNMREFPPELSFECRQYVQNTVHYNSCVLNHKNDGDFLTSEVRVFLGQETEFWSETNETFFLLDDEGKIVHVLEYK